jgi:hypothetical protein
MGQAYQQQLTDLIAETATAKIERPKTPCPLSHHNTMPNKEYPTDDTDNVANQLVKLSKQTTDGGFVCWSTMGAISQLICPDCLKKFASVASKIHALAH